MRRSVFTLPLSPSRAGCGQRPLYSRSGVCSHYDDGRSKPKSNSASPISPPSRSALRPAVFTCKPRAAFESNVLYDTPDRQMRARTEILRIRSYAGRCTLTHKRLPDRRARLKTATNTASKLKPRSPTAMRSPRFFFSLGLVAAFRYEKWRTEWQDGEGHCVVDETPIGNYAELEGSAEWIDRAAARLGVDPARVPHPQLWPAVRPVARAAPQHRRRPHVCRRRRDPGPLAMYSHTIFRI